MEADPLVMYLVAPRRPEGTGGELLAAAAQAAVRCQAAFIADPAWAVRFAAWQAASFRKVCLRARPVELERVRALAHVDCGEVVCLPPRLRSESEPELSSLQAHMGPELVAVSAAPEASGFAGAMVLLIPDDLGMTLGKACAQVAHASLIGQAELPLQGWRDERIDVRLLDRASFERAGRELPVAAVRDAGLTQVAAGTQTVIALAPGAEIPAWLLTALRPVA